MNPRSPGSQPMVNSISAHTVRLFGSPRIETGTGEVVTGRAAQRHRLALLALLALAPAGSLGREKLQAFLWTEKDAESARQLLNQAVYSLRKALGEDAILSVGDDLRLNTEAVRVDALEFDAAVAAGNHEKAVGLHTAPFLDGFFLSDAPEFERWVDHERARLAAAHGRSLESLASAAESAGDHRRAVEWWMARAAHEPYHSGVALRLIEALEASGNRAGALQHASVHERLLREEFGMEPPPEIVTAVERLRREPAPLPPADGARPNTQRSVVAESAPAIAAGKSALSNEAREPAAPVQHSAAASGAPTPAGRRRAYATVLTASLVISMLLVVGLMFGRTRARAGATSPPSASLAVLPLAGHGLEPADAVLADGLTEELIAVLARLPGVRVIASTSVLPFKESRIGAAAIAESLGVTHLIEGGVQKNGSRLRIRLRLIDARDGSTRWSEVYDRELSDIFLVQADVAGSVAREMGVRLPGGSELSARVLTRNVAAYELYVRGTDRTLLRSDSAAREGLALLLRAVDLDSGFAAAWAGVARMYMRVGGNLALAERRRYFELGAEAARRAVQLDGQLADAHATLGIVRMGEFDLENAERHLLRALALEPGRAPPHEWLVSLYLWKGDGGRAIEHARRALDLDPVSPYAHAELARAMIGAGRCEEALELLRKLEGLQPPLPRVPPMKAQCHALGGRWSEAVASIRSQAAVERRRSLALLGFYLGRAGERAEAEAILRELEELEARFGGFALELAVVRAGAGDIAGAAAQLERSLHDLSLVGLPGNPFQLLIVSPLFERVRAEPGSAAAAARIRGRH